LRPQDAALHACRGMALEALGRSGEADAAFTEAFARFPATPEAVRNRIRCSYAFSVYRRLPEKAVRAFESVPREDGHYPEALYGGAMVAVEQGQTQQAIGLLDGAIAANPNLMEARRHRAIQLARAGRFTDAVAEIDRCLGSEPQVGATLYAAACVHARAAAKA